VNGDAVAKVYTVNEVLAILPGLHGQTIHVRGVLVIEFERVCVLHFPNSERSHESSSGLWATFNHAALRKSDAELEQFNGRRVVVMGQVDSRDEGYGHLGAWSAEIVISVVRKV
jgi:hypothetical protein